MQRTAPKLLLFERVLRLSHYPLDEAEVARLVRMGADPRALNSNGDTVLDVARALGMDDASLRALTPPPLAAALDVSPVRDT